MQGGVCPERRGRGWKGGKGFKDNGGGIRCGHLKVFSHGTHHLQPQQLRTRACRLRGG